MHLNPYLGFKDNCAEALAFYEKVLGAKVLAVFKYGESPMAEKMPEADKGKIMHTRFSIAGTTIMASDSMCNYEAPAGFHISINVEEPAEADRIYAALSEGGVIKMAIEETFWAKRFAMFNDKFGTPWMINCEKPMS
jgi:PhnB protein